MYRLAFPACSVEGNQEPVPYGHLVLHGAVPKKCSDCKNLFEGSCRRALSSVETYQVLDHGPCPVKGDAFPVPLSSTRSDKTLFVPQKCINCQNLGSDGIRGFFCTFEQEKWGKFPRSLDWSGWAPKNNLLGIEGRVIATDEVIDDVKNGNSGSAVQKLKSLYSELSTEAAIKCVKIFAKRIGEEEKK